MKPNALCIHTIFSSPFLLAATVKKKYSFISIVLLPLMHGIHLYRLIKHGDMHLISYFVLLIVIVIPLQERASQFFAFSMPDLVFTWYLVGDLDI